MATENAGSLRWTLEADDSSLVKSLSRASDSISDLSDELKRVQKDFDNTSEEARQTSKSVSNIDDSSVKSLSKTVANCANEFLSMHASVNNLASSLSQVKSAGANIFSDITTSANAAVNAVTGLATAIGGTISKYAREGIEGADFIAQANSQLIGLTHSVDGANKALADSVKYYKNNPFDRFSTISATKQLLTFGNSVDDIGELLDKVGNVALANGVSIDEMAARYAEATSQSRVMVGQISELAQVAPGIWGAIGKQIGKTAGEAREELLGVGVSVDVVKKAFDSLVDENAMSSFEKTLARQTNRVKGRMSDVAAAIAGYSTDAQTGFKALDDGLYMSVVNLEKRFADILASSTDAGQRLRTALGRIGKAIAPVIDRLTDNLPRIIDTVIDLIEKLADVIEKVSKALTDSGTDWKAFIPIVGLLGTQLLGFVSTITGGGGAAGGILGAIGQLGSGVKKLNIPMLVFGGTLVKQMATNEKFRKSVQKLLTALGGLAERLFDVLAQMADSEATTKILQALVDVLTVLADTITKLPTPVLEAFIYAMIAGSTVRKLGDFASSIIGVGSALKDTAGKITSFGKTLKSLGKGGLGGVLSGKGDSGKGGIADKVSSTVEGLSGASSELTKGQNMMKTISMGIGNIILMAAAIAAMGKALEVAYNSIPDDIGGLTAKLTVVAGVVTAMGGLATLGNRLGVSKEDVFIEIEIAGAVAALGVALGVANAMIPNDLGVLVPKLITMGVVVVALGGIAAAVGHFDLGDSINEGLLAMVKIAGTIALLALALGVANAAIPSDIGGLAAKLTAMGVVVVAVGALAAIIGHFEGLIANMGSGLLAMIGIAATVAILAGAMERLDKKVSANIGNVAAKIASMAVVVGAFAGLSAAIGAIVMTGVGAVLMGAGMVAMLGIAAEVALLANAIAELDKKVPSNISKVKDKINLLADVAKAMVKANIGGMVSSLGGAVSMAAVVSIVEDYIRLANNLNRLQTIKINKDAVMKSIDTLADVVNYVSGRSGNRLVSLVAGLNNVAKAFETDAASVVVSRYLNLAKMLSQLQTIKLVDSLIFKNLTILGNVVKKITLTNGAGYGIMFTLLKDFASIVDTKSAETVVKSYVDIANSLSKIQGVKLDEDAVLEKVDLIYGIVQRITDTGSGGIIEAVSKGVEAFISAKIADKAQQIVNTYLEIAKKLNEIQAACSTLDADGIQAAIGNLNYIVKRVTDTGTESPIGNILRGFEADTAQRVAENAQSIVNVYADIANKLNKIQDACSTLDSNGIQAQIGNIKYIIKRVTDTGTDSPIGNLLIGWKADTAAQVTDDAEKILETYTKMIDPLNKIGELTIKSSEIQTKLDALKKVVETVAGTRDPDGGIIGTIRAFVAGGMISADSANQIVNVVNSFSKIAKAMNNMEGQPPANWTEKIPAVKNVINGLSGISADSGRMSEVAKTVGSVAGMGSNLSNAVKAINGLDNVDSQKINIVKNIRDFINACFGINDDAPKMASIQNVVWRIQDLCNNITKDTNAINSLPSVNYGDAVKKISDIRGVINACFGINDDAPKMASIQNVVWRMQDLTSNMTAAIGRLNALPTVGRDVYNRINLLKGAIDAVFRINGDAPRMSSIQNVVWRIIDFSGNAKNAINGINGIPTLNNEKIGTINSLRGVINSIMKMPSDAGTMAGVQGVVKSANSVIDDLKNMANKLANLDVGNWQSGLSALTNVVNSVMNQYVTTLNAGIPRVQAVGSQMGSAFAAGINSSLGVVSAAGSNTQGAYWGAIQAKIPDEFKQGAWMVQQFAAGLTTRFGDVAQAGRDTQGAYWNALQGKIADEYGQGGWLVQNVINGIRSKFGALGQAGRDTQGSYWNGLQSKMGDEYGQGSWLAQQVLNGINSHSGQYWGAGRNAVQGFVNGANSMNTYSAGWNIAERFLNGIKNRGKQGSPWKTTMESGRFAVQGLIEGLEAESGRLENEAETLASSVVDAFDKTNIGITPEIEGVKGNVPSVYSATPTVMAEDGSNYQAGVIINQTNNNYTDYSVRKMNRDLRWQLSIA